MSKLFLESIGEEISIFEKDLGNYGRVIIIRDKSYIPKCGQSSDPSWTSKGQVTSHIETKTYFFAKLFFRLLNLNAGVMEAKRAQMHIRSSLCVYVIKDKTDKLTLQISRREICTH